jgi:hypothetical protein
VIEADQWIMDFLGEGTFVVALTIPWHGKCN